MKRAVLYTDGASLGNPGPAGIGVVLVDETGDNAIKLAEPIGYATNNEAEYRAFIRGLELAVQHGVEHLTWYADSELLVRQWRGEYRVRQPHLAQLMTQARALAQKIPHIEAYHTLRTGNSIADVLSKQGAKLARQSTAPRKRGRNGSKKKSG
ncbi:MAG: ribonuclease H [Armatimonadota bacterium]